VLAQWLLQRKPDLRGCAVLELGCGGAVAAIAAKRAGARRVIGNDIDPIALWIAERNARANGVALEFSAMDYTMSALPDVDLVLSVDMFYCRREAERLSRALANARGRGIAVLIADGGRAYAPRDGVNVVKEEMVAVDAELEGVPSRHVRIMTLEA
jgi:predicted nicotinamide N-methyase